VVLIVDLVMLNENVCISLSLGGMGTLGFLEMYKYFLEAVDQTKSIHAKLSSNSQRQDHILPTPLILIFLSLVSCSFFVIPSLFFRFTTFHSLTACLR
jgi:hypothetical protein